MKQFETIGMYIYNPLDQNTSFEKLTARQEANPYKPKRKAVYCHPPNSINNKNLTPPRLDPYLLSRWGIDPLRRFAGLIYREVAFQPPKSCFSLMVYVY
jgi:hypothetical protein